MRKGHCGLKSNLSAALGIKKNILTSWGRKQSLVVVKLYRRYGLPQKLFTLFNARLSKTGRKDSTPAHWLGTLKDSLGDKHLVKAVTNNNPVRI